MVNDKGLNLAFLYMRLSRIMPSFYNQDELNKADTFREKIHYLLTAYAKYKAAKKIDLFGKKGLDRLDKYRSVYGHHSTKSGPELACQILNEMVQEQNPQESELNEALVAVIQSDLKFKFIVDNHDKEPNAPLKHLLYKIPNSGNDQPFVSSLATKIKYFRDKMAASTIEQQTLDVVLHLFQMKISDIKAYYPFLARSLPESQNEASMNLDAYCLKHQGDIVDLNRTLSGYQSNLKTSYLFLEKIKLFLCEFSRFNGKDLEQFKQSMGFVNDLTRNFLLDSSIQLKNAVPHSIRNILYSYEYQYLIDSAKSSGKSEEDKGYTRLKALLQNLKSLNDFINVLHNHKAATKSKLEDAILTELNQLGYRFYFADESLKVVDINPILIKQTNLDNKSLLWKIIDELTKYEFVHNHATTVWTARGAIRTAKLWGVISSSLSENDEAKIAKDILTVLYEMKDPGSYNIISSELTNSLVNMIHRHGIRYYQTQSGIIHSLKVPENYVNKNANTLISNLWYTFKNYENNKWDGKSSTDKARWLDEGFDRAARYMTILVGVIDKHQQADEKGKAFFVADALIQEIAKPESTVADFFKPKMTKLKDEIIKVIAQNYNINLKNDGKHVDFQIFRDAWSQKHSSSKLQNGNT